MDTIFLDEALKDNLCVISAVRIPSEDIGKIEADYIEFTQTLKNSPVFDGALPMAFPHYVSDHHDFRREFVEFLTAKTFRFGLVYFTYNKADYSKCLQEMLRVMKTDKSHAIVEKSSHISEAELKSVEAVCAFPVKFGSKDNIGNSVADYVASCFLGTKANAKGTSAPQPTRMWSQLSSKLAVEIDHDAHIFSGRKSTSVQ